MAEISEHVAITITEDSAGVPRAGFGVPMILSCNAAFAERIRYYSDLPSVLADGFVATSPEYLAAAAMLSQKPKPERIAIGRAVGKPTQVYQVDVTTVRNSHAYVLRLDGQGVTETTCTFTSDATATNDEIVTGLLAAVNAVVGKNFTATSTGGAGSLDLLITGNTAGAWFSVEVGSVDDLKIAQTHALPATVPATDLAAILLENADWYGVYTLYNSDAYVKAVAAWCETQTRLYIADVSDSETVTLAANGGDLADDLKALSYARTAVLYHPNPSNMLGARWLGRMLPTMPGRATWKFKTLKGGEPVSTSATHRTNIRAKNANTYTTIATKAMTWEGKTVDGDFIDITRNQDWLEDDAQKGIFELLQANDIIPMTNAGAAMVQNKLEATFDRAVQLGILDASDPETAPAVSVPKISAVSEADRTARLLPDVVGTGRLAGAIHKVSVGITVSV